MAKQLLVKDLPATATESEIKEFFSSLGRVRSITRKEPSPSQEWLIEMDSQADADRVIELNGDTLDIEAVEKG